MLRNLRAIPVGDVVVAALFVVVAAIEGTFLVEFGPRWPYVANAFVHFALVPAMLLRRTHPVPSFVASYSLLAVLGAVVTLSPLNLGISPALFAAPLSVLAITRHGPSPRWGYAAVFLGIAGSFASPFVRASGLSFLGIAMHVLMLVGCYVWAAKQRQLAERHARDLAEQARAHDARAARAAEEERTMIAREVHDVVAHSLAVARVQASTALAIGGEEHLRAALETIKDLTGSALAETRDLVGSLREQGDTAPAGDLTALPGLAEQARSALPELSVELPTEGDLAAWQQQWPARVRLTVLRVAGEALANLVKHAGGEAMFSLAHADGVVVVEAINSRTRDSGLPGGHGLAGVRERVVAAGGTLEAGPDGDGFALRATIPVASAFPERPPARPGETPTPGGAP
ncbi:sensor histidine kinase [Mariniluteicoccus endophyticus]